MRYQRVLRHGTSLAIVIPAAVCRELGIHRSDVVRLAVLSRGKSGTNPNLLYLEIEPVVEADKVVNTKKNG